MRCVLNRRHLKRDDTFSTVIIQTMVNGALPEHYGPV